MEITPKGINCTLRNGNSILTDPKEVRSSINCTLRNGNDCRVTVSSADLEVLIVPCGMET